VRQPRYSKDTLSYGPPLRSDPPRPPRGIPRSRAYWELKADQMMNRLFDQPQAIDLEDAGRPSARPTSQPQTWIPTPFSPRATPLVRRSSTMESVAPVRRGGLSTPMLVLALAGVAVFSALGTLLYLQYWTQMQQNLQQERNLLLLERLRSLGPASAPSVASQAPPPGAVTLPPPAGMAPAATELPPLPPPPPQQAWIQQLPAPAPNQRPSPPLLSVPVGPRLAAAQAPGPLETGPTPQLLGVMAAPDNTGAAIFQLGESSSSVEVGGVIGASGWRLRSIGADSAVIERGGRQQRLTVASGR